jgi:glycosyltransferase involved in cell wall biosynthesis
VNRAAPRTRPGMPAPGTGTHERRRRANRRWPRDDLALLGRMKILVVHEHYLQAGGEDQVFAAEADLLERYGHRVVRHTVHNSSTDGMGRLALARDTVWSRSARRDVHRLLRRERPDIMHVHNTLPLLSPSIYYAAHDEGVPVVQTLHNFRLVCPSALLFRDGRPCEECVGRRVPLPGVVHACYRSSRAASAVVCAMLTVHDALGTWKRKVDLFIVLTEFARQKFVQGGLPPERLFVKPNFVYPDPGRGAGGGGYALFAGRLCPEKGIDTLLSAWERLGGRAELRIVGHGPLAERTRSRAAEIAGVTFLGRQSRDQVLDAMRAAEFLVFPSLWPEGFPLVLAEAMATGLAVVCSDSGAPPSLVSDGRTGLHFRTGDAEDLAIKLGWMLDHPAEVRSMGGGARRVYERELTADLNYELLMRGYSLAASKGREPSPVLPVP